MNQENQIKQLVKEKYNEIALQDKLVNQSSCCGSGCCSNEVYNIMTDDYSQLSGYVKEADLALGCGLPTEYANIKPGDTVLDLGSGAGNDCFIARSEVGSSGKVIGIDFTPAMIEKAQKNAILLKYDNVEFILGDIENLPLQDNSVDVVVSNCVLNLVPNKTQVFKEIYRVLKNGGHFCISDIVLEGTLPDKILNTAEMYAGCVSGAIQKESYLNLIQEQGFKDISVKKIKSITIPDDILAVYLTSEEIDQYRLNSNIIQSITVFAKKTESCCSPGCCN